MDRRGWRRSRCGGGPETPGCDFDVDFGFDEGIRRDRGRDFFDQSGGKRYVFGLADQGDGMHA